MTSQKRPERKSLKTAAKAQGFHFLGVFGAGFFLFFLPVLAQVFLPAAIRSQSYLDQELTSRNLVLPELEQFNLGARLFWEKNKKLAAWKAFQTFLYNYPDSHLAADAQFMVAESVFNQAVLAYRSGNPPDELSWKKQKKSGLKVLGKGFKRGFQGLKKIGAKVSGEPEPIDEPDRIDFATFSEAIDQYSAVLEDYRKSGLADTALFRIGECYFNMGDYPMALEHFKKLQKQFPQSYLMGESILASAQCYLPGGDFGSAELEINRLVNTFSSYKDSPQVQFIVGIIRYQEGRYEEAIKNLEKIQSPEAIYYTGQALIKMGKALSATAKFKKLVQDYKDSHFAELSAYLIGESFFLSQNYLGAVQEYKNFLNLYPQSTLKEVVLYRIGASYFLNKDYSSARESFNLIVNSFPQGEYAPLAKYFISESYRFSKQMKEASFSYGQLINTMPSAPIAASAKFKLAWVTYTQKNYNGALDAFQRFIDWDPFHPWAAYAYLLMGNCYTYLNRPEDAANSYQQAADRSPKTEIAESAMALLNRTRYSQANYGQLTTAYTYILRSLPPSESKWRAISQLYLGDSYYRQKLYREAISVFQSIIALYPNQPVAAQAYDGLSWCYFQLGDYDQSQTMRQRIKEVRLPEGVAAPVMTSGSYELANALFNQKKYTEALEYYQKFLADSPESQDVPEATYRIGLCYYRQEYYTQAIAIWLELETKYPKHPRTEEAVFQVADTYFRAQKYEDAIATYRKILVNYPKNPGISDATLRIGQSYYNAGNDDRAVTELDAFLRKFPKDPKALETLDLLEASFDRMETQDVQNWVKQRQKGISILRGLVDDFPQTSLAAEAQFRIARRHFNWKDYSNSLKGFEQVSLTYPDSPHIAEAEFYAGECHYVMKNFPETVNTLERFLRNFPTSEFVPAALFHLGTAQFNQQNYEEAIQSYQRLAQEHPQSEFTGAGLYNLGLCQKKLQKLTDAAETYYKLALNYPQDPNATLAMMEVGRIKQDLKLYGEAILIYKDLNEKFPQGSDQKLEIACLIAECYVGNEDPEEAIKILKSVASQPPQNSSWKLEALRILGEIYEKKESWSEAVSVYEEGGKWNASFKERARYLRQTYLGGTASPQGSKGAPKTGGR